uniref:Protein RRP5 homolog n=2 Tax=Crocodylus porosus TaxID=8502 RepID=A0A7M4F194_CROPO
MASTEESFPRGGTQKKPEKGRAPRQSIEQDNLFDTHHEEGSQKRKRNQEQPEKRKKLKAEKKQAVKDRARDFDLLTVETLSEGVLLLGCVKEANSFELVVSLPNGLTGFVQVTDICDSYTQMLSEQVAKQELDLNSLSDLYPPGMLVRCAVTSLQKTTDGHQSVKLSINPKDVNKALNTLALRSGMLLSGLVSSVEDHGYLIDVGVSGTKAFLPRQKAQDYLKSSNKGAELKIGQYLNCLVEEVKNSGRIVRLSVGRSEVAAAIATEEQNWTLSNLLPGLVVKAQVQKVTPYGLTLSFLSSFTGIVDFMHLDPKKVGSYSQNQTVKACILSVHPTSKAVRFTLRQAFFQPGGLLSQLSSDRFGAVVAECTVKGFYKKAGAIFQLEDGTLAFARLRHLSNTINSFKPRVFKTGSKHTCRIIDYILRAVTELFVNGKVLALKPHGMQVKVTDHIKGLVPRLHLADMLLKQPEKKYSMGEQVKCRVLLSHPEERKLILTLKRTLIGSKLPVLASYTAAKPGLVTHGVVVCAREFGCIVKFYNDVKGLVPRNELGSEPIPSPEKVFREGQVVKVTILKCEPEQEKLLLSFNLTSKSQFPLQGCIFTCLPLSLQMVDVKVLKKREDGLEVSILSDNVPAHLPMMHLSDHIVNCKLLWHWLQEEDILPRVMCLSDKGGHVMLCRKPALISAVEEGQVVRSFSEIQPGMQLTGFVKNIMPYGVFVEFPFGLAGLAPKAAMSDKFVTDTKEHFVVGQTVVAKVTSIDEVKQRVLLCLKLSECSVEDPAAKSISLLSQCFEEMKEVRSIMRKRGEVLATQNLCSLMFGQKLDLVVQEVKEDGSALFSGSSIAGLTVTATSHHLGGQEYRHLVPGQKARALILHVNALKSEVHVSLREELLNQKVKQLKENSQHSAVVQHVAEEFAIASLVETGQLTAIPVACHFNDTFRFDSERLKVGQTILVTLKTVKPGEHGVLLAVQSPAKAVIRPRKESETFEETLVLVQHSLCIGDTVTGKVKSVKPTHITVAISDNLTGCIHASQILDKVPIGTFPTSKLRPGQKVTAWVIGGRDVKTAPSPSSAVMVLLSLSFVNSVLKGKGCTILNTEGDELSKGLKAYKVGQTVTCFIKKYNVIKGWLEVEVTPNIRGRIPHLLLSLKPKVFKHPEKSFRSGQALSATVTGMNPTSTNLCLSLTGIYSLEKGTITLGTIKNVTPHVGLIVALPFGKIGNASLFHLSDSYMEQPWEHFRVGEIVRCFLTLVSLVSCRTNPKSNSEVEDAEITCIDDVKEGQLIRGYVKCIKASGVFFALSSSVVGRIRFQKVAPYFVSKQAVYEEYLPEGKLLTARVLSVNSQEDHIELSLLPKDTGKLSVLPKSLGLPFHETKQEKKGEELKLKAKRRRRDSESEQVATSFNIKQVAPVLSSFKQEVKHMEAPRLQVSTGFTWDEGLNALKVPALSQPEESSDSEEEDDPQAMQAEDLYHTMLKRFRQEKSVWLKHATFLLKRGQTEATHRLLEHALRGLPVKEHVDVISKFAQLEFQFGDPDHAKALFESTLSSYPKRTDIWSIYIDMLIKHGSQKEVRDVFERVIHLSLAPKRMKFFFKRYLDYEKKYGTADTIQAVKAAALGYVESKSSLVES